MTTGMRVERERGSCLLPSKDVYPLRGVNVHVPQDLIAGQNSPPFLPTSNIETKTLAKDHCIVHPVYAIHIASETPQGPQPGPVDQRSLHHATPG